MEAVERLQGRFRMLYRFSLFTLLLLMSCTAGYLAGYRWGGQDKSDDIAAGTNSSRTYYVGDIVSPSPAEHGDKVFNELIDLIVASVRPEEWSENGGVGQDLRPFPGNMSLIVSAKGATHVELARFLETLRDLKFKLPEDFQRQVRAMEARKLTGPHIVKAFTQTTVTERNLLEEQFSSGVRQLSETLGLPRTWRAGEEGFPKWATAQQIAVWRRPGGQLYFALQDCRPQGQAIVTGWWEESFGVLQPLELAIAEH